MQLYYSIKLVTKSLIAYSFHLSLHNDISRDAETEIIIVIFIAMLSEKRKGKGISVSNRSPLWA